MDKNKIWIWALLFMLTMSLVLTNDVNANHVSSPTCNYLLVGASNISDAGQTQNQTFTAVISTTSNQTQTGAGATFVRLQNQNGFTLFTNTTGIPANTSGETATYTVQYAPNLDAQQRYLVSATFYFLNNSFYNYSGTSFGCPNTTFTVNPASGGYIVNQQQVVQAQQATQSNYIWIIIIAAVIVVIYFSDKK